MCLVGGLHARLRRLYNRWLRPNPLEELKARGLTVGDNFAMLDGVRLDWSHCWHITIGDDVTLAPDVRILAHDASTKRPLGYTRIGKVVIGDRVFIGAGSIVLPGVRIGSDVIVGAGSVVTKNVPDNTVVSGNPAKAIATVDEWLDRKKLEMESVPCFGAEYTVRQGVSAHMKAEMNERMKDGIGYVV